MQSIFLQFSVLDLKLMKNSGNECCGLSLCFKVFLYVKCLICNVWEAFSPVFMSSCLLSRLQLTSHPPPTVSFFTCLLLINYLSLKLTLIPPPRSFLLTQTNQQPLFPGDTDKTAVSNYSVIISPFIFFIFIFLV